MSFDRPSPFGVRGLKVKRQSVLAGYTLIYRTDFLNYLKLIHCVVIELERGNRSHFIKVRVSVESFNSIVCKMEFNGIAVVPCFKYTNI